MAGKTTKRALADLLPDWERYLDMTASPRTVEAYTPTVEQFVRALPSGEPSVEAVEAWVVGLTGAPATRSQRISAVRSFLTYGREHGALERIPEIALKRPKVTVTSGGHHLTLEEARALVAVSRTLSDRHYAIVLGLLTTGARVSELAAARWADLEADDLDPDRIGLNIVFGKGGRSRFVPVTPELYEVLARIRGSAALDASDLRPLLPSRSDKRGAGGHYSYRSIERLFREVVEAAGAALHGKRPTCHWARHTSLSLCAADPSVSVWSLQQAAGHVSPAVTALYIHRGRALAESALNHIPALV